MEIIGACLILLVVILLLVAMFRYIMKHPQKGVHFACNGDCKHCGMRSQK